MLFGGFASGPAFNASIIIENISMVVVHKLQMMQELMDSDTGYVTIKYNEFPFSTISYVLIYFHWLVPNILEIMHKKRIHLKCTQ